MKKTFTLILIFSIIFNGCSPFRLVINENGNKYYINRKGEKIYIAPNNAKINKN